MKWNTAIKKIEQALEEDGVYVNIHYHRKWMKNDAHYGYVKNVVEYEWKGQICKAVNTYSDQLIESTHIIDDVTVDHVKKGR